MRFLEFVKKIDMTRLDELQIRYKSDNTTHWDFIAHRQFIWLFDHSDQDEIEDDVEQLTGATIENARERPDIVAGTFDGTNLWLYDQESGHHPQVSAYIRKVAQTLGASNVSHSAYVGGQEEEREFEYDFYQIGKGVPDVALHGTNTSEIRSLLRFGLDPSRGTGNWETTDFGDEGVGKFELNFLTVRPASAMFHANRSAARQGGAPIILHVKIPDKNQIGPDFDVAKATGLSDELADVLGFTGSYRWEPDKDWESEQQAVIAAKSGQNLWKHAGLFSYRGRIPANHIVGIEADFSGDDYEPEDIYGSQMHDFGNDFEAFWRAFELYQDYGYWHEDLEMELEAMRDEEEEDEDEEYDESVGGSQAGAGDDSAEYEEFVTPWEQPESGHGWH